MFSTKSHLLSRFVSASIIVCALAFQAFAQDDSDPNSPTPVLLTEKESTRALAARASKTGRVGNPIENGAFAPDSKIVLFVTNLDLMENEGANAFRVYAENAKGLKYRFPVLRLQPVKGQEGVFAITVRLKDEIGFWEPPTADGDLSIYLTWRGLSSNRVKLGYGRTGGYLKDEGTSSETALKNATQKGDSGSTSELVGYRWSGDRMRFLEQSGFGPTDALDSRVRRIGLRTYLAEQFNAPYPSTNNPYPIFPLKSGNRDDVAAGCGAFLPSSNATYQACIRDHYTMYPVQKWFFTEAFYGEPQLRHRVTWALSQIWVVSASGGDTQQSRHMIEYYKILANNSFGNFRDIMQQMTLNPGMGNYLSMARSTKNNPNENYAREILQLFTIGLFMLNPDGTLQMSGGNPIPTYDQNLVNNFTKVFTGFGFCETTGPSCPNRALGAPNYIDPLLLNQNNHDVTAKTLLNYPGAVNVNIPAATNGNTELTMALDNIFNHPNVGPFVSKLLIQHLVTSDPTPAYVGRVAAVFNNNGLSVRGDLKAVVRAILLDPEARGDVKTDPNFGKLREPVQLLTNVSRAFNVRGATITLPSDGVVNQLVSPLAQSSFNSPTVFNYYSPDFVIPGTSLLGPEFHIMTTGTSIGRANLGNTLVFNRVNVSLPNTPNGTSLDFTEMQSLAAADATGNLLVDALNRKMLHGTMSAAMRSNILTAVTNIVSTNSLARAQQAIYLIATSSQYQVQR